ncbi:MAG: LysM peptidoglycan-binding domain-containing protein [Opitutaceae bacterium]
MRIWSWLLVGACLAPPALRAQASAPPASAVEVANLREDVRGLAQRLADLELRVEQLEAENASLQSRLAAAGQGAATASQLHDAIAAVRSTIASAVAASRSDILAQVDARLAQAEQSRALSSGTAESARGEGGGAAVGAPAFGNDFSKQGITYVVQRGDTVASIAKKNGARFRDIVNANRLANPSIIHVGQTLFIPQSSK